MLCCGVRWVKKKVDESPMMKQMKMLTGSLSPPANGQAGAAGSGAVMDPMMMNPLLNPFGMMGMGGMGMGMPSPTAANGNGNASAGSDDPTDVVDAPVNAGTVIDPSAMMMANPFLFPFGPPLPGMMPPGGAAGAAGMPPGLFLPPFGMMGMGMPPIGAAGRPIRRRPGTAPAKQADWQPEVD